MSDFLGQNVLICPFCILLIILYPDMMKIKQETVSIYQLNIVDFYNIPIGNVKNLVSSFFDKGKHVLHYENLQLYLRLRLKQKSVAY